MYIQWSYKYKYEYKYKYIYSEKENKVALVSLSEGNTGDRRGKEKVRE
jgi:hypothetical protein